MNFLAHLHLASLAESSPLGNLMADFVKGDPFCRYPQTIAEGIMMHRRVDRFTDTMALVKQARSLFSANHYRVAPITLDIIWDHFLAKYWSELECSLSLSAFSHRAENQVTASIDFAPEAFKQLNRVIWQERWLERYSELTFIDSVLNAMARKRPRLGLLATSIEDIEINYDELKRIFMLFYPDMMARATRQAL